MGLIDIETMIQIEKELHEEVDKNILIWRAMASRRLTLAESMQTLKGSQKIRTLQSLMTTSEK